MSDNRSLFSAIVGDGSPLLLLSGLGLLLSGAFALFLSATGHFLPHDEAFLGMTAQELCSYHQCRVVHFMFHDRTAFGGALVAIGGLYLWLVEFPLRERRAWAWWALAVSGFFGFVSFLFYLGYGYLDTWHGVATMVMLPIFGGGLIAAWKRLDEPRGWRVVLARGWSDDWKSSAGLGRLFLIGYAQGLCGAGTVISVVGMTRVFVPQDLEFMQITTEELRAIHDRLVPLIAHDRAGFGGALLSTGLAMLITIWCAAPSRHLWQILVVTGCVGFSTALGVHYVVGYMDFIHLLPGYLGAMVFFVGIALSRRPMLKV